MALARRLENKINYIWFDLGYTLLYMQRETTYKKALEKFDINISIEEIEKGFHLMDKYFMREYRGVFGGERDTYMPWYLGALNFYLNIRVNIYDIDRAWHDIQKETKNYWLPYSGVHEVLKDLKEKGLKLGVISNWDDTAREILSKHDLIDYFEHIIISSEVGYEKPDPRIFEIALEEADVYAENCLYIGDNYYDDCCSENVGMKYLIIDRFGGLGIEEIKNHLIIRDILEMKEYLLEMGLIETTTKK